MRERMVTHDSEAMKSSARRIRLFSRVWWLPPRDDDDDDDDDEKDDIIITVLLQVSLFFLCRVQMCKKSSKTPQKKVFVGVF